MNLRPIVGALLCLPALARASQMPAQDVTLEEVLARAGEYVVKLHAQVSGIVAEETYLQQARDLRRRTTGGNVNQRKTLKSDLLLVKPPDVDRYIEFRDVFEVNGIAVRDRQERLTKLFLTPTVDSANQIKAIADESARHNIGDVTRNINTPMLSLHFLLPAAQKRFQFRRQRGGTPELGNHVDFPEHHSTNFVVPGDLWVIGFNERAKPTLIRGNRGDFPSTGRFWIDPATGAIRMTELLLQDSDLNAVINVSFRHDATVGFLVPAEMRERYRGTSDRVEGIATYARFRKFQVTTDQSIQKPPGR